MEEGGSRQDHGELTGVVGVVEPGLVVDVPRVIPPGEPHDAISGLAPHSETQQDATSARLLFRFNYLKLSARDLITFL